MFKWSGITTAPIVALVLAGVAVSSHAQTAGLAYRLTVTIDGGAQGGVVELCREAGNSEFYVIVTRLDSELQDQIANVNRETSQIARLADPDLDSLRTRDLNSEFDPLSETERLSLERLRGVPASDRTDDERRELQALESKEPLSSAELRMLQRMDELLTLRGALTRQLQMRTRPSSPASLRVYPNDELQVVLMEADVFSDDTCLSSNVVLDHSVLDKQVLEIKQGDTVLLTLMFTPIEQ